MTPSLSLFSHWSLCVSDIFLHPIFSENEKNVQNPCAKSLLFIHFFAVTSFKHLFSFQSLWSTLREHWYILLSRTRLTTNRPAWWDTTNMLIASQLLDVIVTNNYNKHPLQLFPRFNIVHSHRHGRKTQSERVHWGLLLNDCCEINVYWIKITPTISDMVGDIPNRCSHRNEENIRGNDVAVRSERKLLEGG